MEKERNRKIVIYSTGKQSQVCVDGRVFGIGIKKINFSHEAGNTGELNVVCGILPIMGDGSDEAIDGFLRTVTDLCKNSDTAIIGE